jgi:aryl-alcohol dehydrogenase-like predicted oxidoreductase
MTTRTTHSSASATRSSQHGTASIGLGCMGMSGMYGATDDQASIRTIQTAIDRGVRLLDTGDFYGMGHNELLIGRAILGRRERVELSVKFGALRGPDNSWQGMDTRPVAVKNFAAYSLKRLGVDVIDIYRPARLDPAVPIEDTVGAIAELIQAGYVRKIGLSEVGVETLRRAQSVHPIVDLQIEYSIATRSAEAKIFPVLHELGIGATLYGVFSRGLLTGSKPQAQAGDFRAHLPRFTAQHRDKNAAVVGALHEFARERGMSPGQLAVAWVLAREPSFTPVVGAKTVVQLEDALGALERPLSDRDLEQLDAMGGVLGERYGTEAMKQLDSERG